MPLRELKSFERLPVKKGEAQTLRFRIPISELEKWDMKEHRWKLYNGQYHVLVGAGSQDIRLDATINISDDK